MKPLSRPTCKKALGLTAILTCAFPLMGTDQTLHCELRGSDHGSTVFTNHSPGQFHPGHFHFLLFSDSDGLKVYKDWNSWGYYARSFTGTDAASRSYSLTLRKTGFTQNAPATDTLNKGEFLITDIYLCDGSWHVAPKLPIRAMIALRLVGHFAIAADKDAITNNVWTGQIKSNELEVFIDKACVERLNATELLP
jgi:hypothetical protein